MTQRAAGGLRAGTRNGRERYRDLRGELVNRY